MVVNYDLPLMNERDRGGDERPDIETYLHRIGAFLLQSPSDNTTYSDDPPYLLCLLPGCSQCACFAYCTIRC